MALPKRFHIQIVTDERLLAKKGISSAIDPDARFGRKSISKSFFGYKTHLTMTEEEIITDLVVTPGNEDDGRQLQTLVNNSRKKHPTIKEVFADTAYSSKDNLSFLQTENIKANFPLNPIVYGQRKGTRKRIEHKMLNLRTHIE